MKKNYWSVEFLHPATNTVIETKTFDGLKEIAEHYKNIPLTTWRNIAIGRCKVYKKFIKICKKQRTFTVIETTESE